MVEKTQCLVWAVANAAEKAAFNRVLTKPQPDDTARHDAAVSAAEAAVAAADLDAKAAAAGGAATAVAAAPKLADVLSGASSKKSSAKLRRLLAVVSADAWLTVRDLHHQFDDLNAAEATAHRREEARLISYSQPGGGAGLARLPDHSLPYTTPTSAATLAVVQRHLGLYLTALKDPLDALAARGEAVTQHQRLGDAALHAANQSARHKAGLRVLYHALTALEAPGLPTGTLTLGDRGDGTPAGKEDARRRHAHVNATHVPDLYRVGEAPLVVEYKCYDWAVVKPLQGLGARHTGGCPSQADGWLTAFGGTEEELRRVVCGLAARGEPGTDPHDRTSGLGWVAAKDGDYSDALAKGYRLNLYATEPSGAVCPGLDTTLRRFSRLSRAPTTKDLTGYGRAKSSPRDFYRHYLAAHAAAVTLADANVILNDASNKSFWLARG